MFSLDFIILYFCICKSICKSSKDFWLYNKILILSQECKNPGYPDVPAICCRVPPEEGVGPNPPNPPVIQIHDTCPGGTICSDLQQCRTGYDFLSTIDTSVFNSVSGSNF